MCKWGQRNWKSRTKADSPIRRQIPLGHGIGGAQGSLWGTASWVVLKDPCPQLLWNPLCLGKGRFADLLLVSRMWQKRWNVARAALWKHRDCHLGCPSLISLRSFAQVSLPPGTAGEKPRGWKMEAHPQGHTWVSSSATWTHAWGLAFRGDHGQGRRPGCGPVPFWHTTVWLQRARHWHFCIHLFMCRCGLRGSLSPLPHPKLPHTACLVQWHAEERPAHRHPKTVTYIQSQKIRLFEVALSLEKRTI